MDESVAPGARHLSDEIRTASLFVARGVKEGQLDSVMLAGPQSGAGATTTTLAIARDLVEVHGLRPLVVEIDRRRSALGEIFRLDPDRSLEAVAARKIGALAAVQQSEDGLSMVRSTNGRPGGFLPGGVAPVLARVVAEAKDAFDVVLVDAPPVLESEAVFEAGQVVPRLILVVEAARSRSEVLERVQRELEVADIDLLGAVLNKHRRVIPGWMYRWFAG